MIFAVATLVWSIGVYPLPILFDKHYAFQENQNLTCRVKKTHMHVAWFENKKKSKISKEEHAIPLWILFLVILVVRKEWLINLLGS